MNRDRLKHLAKRWLERRIRKGINSLYTPERARLYPWIGPLLEIANARVTLPSVNIFHLITLQCAVADQEHPINVLYAAREDVDWDENLRYASFLLFGDRKPTMSQPVTCMAGQLRKRVEQMSTDVDLVCVDAHRVFIWQPRHGEWVISPQQVRMVLDFEPGETWEQVEKRFRSQRANLRQVRRAGFTHRYATEADLDFFYHRMYLPLAHNRYADFAYVDREKTLQDWLRRGELVFIVDQEGRDIAGSVNINQGRVKFMMVNGVLDADPELISRGALSSVYYHCMRIGFENGFSRCDFGETRPFEDDGVFQHKVHWGMKTLRDPWGVNRWLFWAPNGSPFARRWLREKRFIRELSRFGGWSPASESPVEEEIALSAGRKPADPERTENRVA